MRKHKDLACEINMFLTFFISIILLLTIGWMIYDSTPISVLENIKDFEVSDNLKIKLEELKEKGVVIKIKEIDDTRNRDISDFIELAYMIDGEKESAILILFSKNSDDVDIISSLEMAPKVPIEVIDLMRLALKEEFNNGNYENGLQKAVELCGDNIKTYKFNELIINSIKHTLSIIVMLIKVILLLFSILLVAIFTCSGAFNIGDFFVSRINLKTDLENKEKLLKAKNIAKIHIPETINRETEKIKILLLYDNEEYSKRIPLYQSENYINEPYKFPHSCIDKDGLPVSFEDVLKISKTNKMIEDLKSNKS